MQDRDQDWANTVPHQWNYHCTWLCKVPSLCNPSGHQPGASKPFPTLGYNLLNSPWTNDQPLKTSWALHIPWVHMFWAAYRDTSASGFRRGPGMSRWIRSAFATPQRLNKVGQEITTNWNYCIQWSSADASSSTLIDYNLNISVLEYVKYHL